MPSLLVGDGARHPGSVVWPTTTTPCLETFAPMNYPVPSSRRLLTFVTLILGSLLSALVLHAAEAATNDSDRFHTGTRHAQDLTERLVFKMSAFGPGLPVGSGRSLGRKSVCDKPICFSPPARWSRFSKRRPRPNQDPTHIGHGPLPSLDQVPGPG